MKYTNYNVTCTSCNGSDVLKITPDRTIFYEAQTPIVSARFRPDLQWGFECLCGQDSRVAKEEEGQIEMLVQGGGSAIEAIRESLKIDNSTKFLMEKI